jgi:hypothetical protein
MSHTFLALDMGLIPQSTKDNVPTFWQGLFSNDNTRMLIDGRNNSGELVHPQTVLGAWLQWSDNPKGIELEIISTAIEYTAEEIKAEQQDISSMWYVETKGES